MKNKSTSSSLFHVIDQLVKAPAIGEARERELLKKAHSFIYFHSPEKDLAAHFFFPPGHEPQTARVPVILFLHGGTPTAKRQEMVDRFQEAGNDIPVFVLSLKAGGVGLNLTAANHVFHFDRWWNPAVENQATDRAFRIGQTRAVQVHKFVCSGTLEERIDRMIESKVELAKNIVGSGENWLTELDTDELRNLLTFRGGDFGDDE